MKINDLINPFEFSGYLITSDEYVRDYMVLPDEFSSCLFKLRLGYAMKGSPLTQEEVFALYPVLTENRRHILDTVTARFFKKDKELLNDWRNHCPCEKKPTACWKTLFRMKCLRGWKK